LNIIGYIKVMILFKHNDRFPCLMDEILASSIIPYVLQVKFDMFEKIDVNGEKTHPLWSYLKKEQGGLLGSFIKWNFTKFIVDKEGKVVERHGPNVDPHKLKDSLEKYF